MNTRTSWRTGKRAIPISVPIAYNALLAAAVKGETVGGQIPCPHCLTVGSLIHRGRLVARGSRWPGRGGIEDRETPVPECICTVCQKRFRVLSVEIAPYKSYTRPVIETACTAYLHAPRHASGLRQTVRRMGAGHPDPASLHGWLGGLGARALGRLDRQGLGPPVAALIAESAQRLSGELQADWTSRLSERSGHPVSPTKYHSVQRREQLEACARLFDRAARLFPQAAYPWSAWEEWLQSRFHVTAWGFPARLSCTAIQHHGPRKVVVPCAPSRPRWSRRPACRGTGAGRKDGKAHGARSPP
jgi:hypothetical protein